MRLNQAHCTALLCVVSAGMLHSHTRLDLHEKASKLGALHLLVIAAFDLVASARTALPADGCV